MVTTKNITDFGSGFYHGAIGSLKTDTATLLRLYTPKKRERIMMMQERKVPTTICGVVGEAMGILGYKTTVAASALYGAYHLLEKIVSN
jgi:hypothetical protein